MSWEPVGSRRLAMRSPKWKSPYKRPALERPSHRSLQPMRVLRSSGPAASARPPSASPVPVMRCQNRRRGPPKVSPNRAAAKASPNPRTDMLLRIANTGPDWFDAGPDHGRADSGRQGKAEYVQQAEGRVQLGGLQVDLGDGALLSLDA